MKDFLTPDDVQYLGIDYEGVGGEIVKSCEHVIAYEGRPAYYIRDAYRVREELQAFLETELVGVTRGARYNRTVRALARVEENIADIEAWQRNRYNIHDPAEVRRRLEGD